MTKPLRVVTMIDSLLAGGAERVAVELACGLDRTRYAPHVLVTRGDGPLRALLDAAHVPVTMLDRRSSRDLRPWLRAHTLIRGNADIVHAHKFGSNVWASLLARTTGVPLIVHEHNFSAAPSRMRAIIDRRWIGPVAAHVVCVSDSVADVERANGIPDARIDVVPNGVRLDDAISRDDARRELGLDPDAFVVGIVGRLRPEKAHEVLLSALARMRDTTATVCVVGDGPRAQELRNVARELDVATRVTWAGERRDAARLARAFDVSVVCSHWEGLPLAALEAMAAGVPLVASAVGGLPTLLNDDAGLLVPAGDSERLADALDELSHDPAARQRLAMTGRQRIADAYSFQAMVRRIQQLYDSTCGRSSQSNHAYTEAA